MPKQYDTIRNTARETSVPSSLIRRLVAQGICPGFYSGNRFYVNIPKLLEQLEQGNTLSRKEVR